MPEPGKCSSCGAAILWCKTTNGHATPVDAEPSPKGNMMIEGDVARVIPKADLFESPPEGPLYTSHFATCSDPKRFRKRTKQ